MNKEELLALMRAPKTAEDLAASFARIDAAMAKDEARKKQLVAKYFPDHVGHEKEEGNWKYFDAMFVSFDMICSCGETLTITRDMCDNTPHP